MKSNTKHKLVLCTLSISTTLLIVFILCVLAYASLHSFAIYDQLTEGDAKLNFCNKVSCYKYFIEIYQTPLEELGIILKAFPALAFTIAAKTYILNVQNATISNKVNVGKDFFVYLDDISPDNFPVDECVNKRQLFNSTFDFDSHMEIKINSAFHKAVKSIKNHIINASNNYGTDGNRFDCDAHIKYIRDALSPIGIKINDDIARNSWDSYEKDILCFLDSIYSDWFYDSERLSDMPRDYIASFNR